MSHRGTVSKSIVRSWIARTTQTEQWGWAQHHLQPFRDQNLRTNVFAICPWFNAICLAPYIYIYIYNVLPILPSVRSSICPPGGVSSQFGTSGRNLILTHTRWGFPHLTIGIYRWFFPEGWKPEIIQTIKLEKYNSENRDWGVLESGHWQPVTRTNSHQIENKFPPTFNESILSAVFFYMYVVMKTRWPLSSISLRVFIAPWCWAHTCAVSFTFPRLS